MTERELELISDINMHIFIEKGITGCIFTVLKDSARLLTNICNVMTIKKPSKYIIYLDANSLYGWAMI